MITDLESELRALCPQDHYLTSAAKQRQYHSVR